MTLSSATTPNSTSSKPFFSLHIRLMSALSLSFLALFLLIFVVLLRALETGQLNQARVDLEHVVQRVAAQVDGEEVAQLYGPDGELVPDYWKNPLYLKNFAGLKEVNSTDPRAFPFAYIGEGGKFELVASPTGRQATLPNDPIALAAGLLPSSSAAFLSEIPIHQQGHFLTGTVPIKDSSGRVVCAMGVSFRIDYVYNAFLQVRDRSWQVMGVLYLALLVLFTFISRRFSQPVSRLALEMRTIREGDYQRNFSHLRRSPFRDEVSTLSEVFEDLLSRVSQREQTLVQEVQDLRIEIDAGKRASQVAEIVESEGFIDLREKARAMRERRARGTS
jgi:hypothetical protein